MKVFWSIIYNVTDMLCLSVFYKNIHKNVHIHMHIYVCIYYI